MVIVKNLGYLAFAGIVFLGLLYYQEVKRENMFKEKATLLVTQIFHEKGYNVSCKKVVLNEEITDNFYSATAYLNNGNTVKISIEAIRQVLLEDINSDEEQWNIVVSIPNQ